MSIVSNIVKPIVRSIVSPIAKDRITELDAQFARVQPFLELDGVDDYGLFSDWIPSADFSVQMTLAPSTGVSHLIADSVSVSRIFQNSTLSEIQLTTTTTDTKWTGVLTLNSVNNIRFDREASILSSRLNGEYLTPVGGITNSGDLIVDSYGRVRGAATGIPIYSGYVGVLKLIDYANPSNSRYYVPTATGLVDLLGDGSTNGTYNGSPAAPELFYRVGDNWQNADASVIIPAA